MSDSTKKGGTGCSSGCSKCSSLEQCGQHPGALSGWPLVGSTLCVFLLPLVMATAGAILAGPEEMHQFAGAFGGLAAGLVVGVILARFIGRSTKEKA